MSLWKSIGRVSFTNQFVTTFLKSKERYCSFLIMYYISFELNEPTPKLKLTAKKRETVRLKFLVKVISLGRELCRLICDMPRLICCSLCPQAGSPEDVPPVIATPHHYLLNIYRNQLYFVAVVTTEGLYTMSIERGTILVTSLTD